MNERKQTDLTVLKNVVTIPVRLTEKYALAQHLGLELKGFPNVPVKDQYPLEEFTFWEDFLSKEKKRRAGELADADAARYIREHCAENCTKRVRSRVRAEYMGTQEHREAVEQAKRTDEEWLRLNAAATGDHAMLLQYEKYHRDRVKQRLKQQNDVLDKALIAYNMTFIDAFAENLANDPLLEQMTERQIGRLNSEIETFLRTKPLYIPDGAWDAYDQHDGSNIKTEITVRYLAQDFQFDTESFIHNVVLRMTGDECYEDHIITEVIAQVSLLEGLKEIIADKHMERSAWYALSDHLTDPVYDLAICAHADHFSEEKILDLISQNPRYSGWGAQRQRYVSDKEAAEKRRMEKKRQEAQEKARLIAQINTQILERIPDDLKDLYPAARSMKRRFVLHLGPTNSGKTFTALEAFRKAGTGVYLGPLRLLAYEVYEGTNAAGVPCSMITGEEELLVADAMHYAQTIETVSLSAYYNVAVIDEGQMIADRQRGGAWTEAILGVCAEEIHVCAAPEAEQILVRLIEQCGDSYTIERRERFTPLRFEDHRFNFPADIKNGDVLVVFSRNAVLDYAERLRAMNIPCSVIYGALPYDVRRQEVQKFISGETRVAVATDAIGMGLNLPVRRIVFMESEKYDGRAVRPLTTQEILQIAGRAGRFGIFEEGSFTAADDLYLFKAAYKSEPAAIKEARVSFPRRLISVEGNLSQILTCWNDAKAAAPFVKADLSREKTLSAGLEKHTQDKSLIYSLITIPFNERNEDVRAVWDHLSLRCCRGEKLLWLDFQEELEYPVAEYGSGVKSLLRKLEVQYQICDLLYYCYNRLAEGEERTKRKADLLSRKATLSEMINETLSQYRKQKQKKVPGEKKRKARS